MRVKDLNYEKPMVMHIDLNSAFATAEQQAHPSLRGKPMGVTNRWSKECCVIAASYEAKALGVKVGTRRTEAMALCPGFIMLESDPTKYQSVFEKLVAIFEDYSAKVKMKSVDEGILDFHGMEPVLKGRSLQDIGYEIKQRVKEDVGEWMTINVGVGTNRFLAKQAAGWHKPDGLDVIDSHNLIDYYKQIELMDISGIAEKYAARLNALNIFTPMQFFEADEYLLKKQAFRSINGHHWYRRLRGWEQDDYETKLGMVGRQWVIDKPSDKNEYLLPCLSYLCETTGAKLRFRNVEARGVEVWVVYVNDESWKAKRKFKTTFYTNQEIYRRAMELFTLRPHGIVRTMGITCYGLEPSAISQLEFFDDVRKKRWISEAMDEINDAYGLFTIHIATTTRGKKHVKQKIPFNGTEYFELLLKRA